VSCYFLESTAFAKLFVQEQGTDALIRLMEAVEDNRKLISASTPLEVYAAVRRRERADGISAEDATAALDILRWPDTLQLAAAIVARDMFQGTEIIFVSASPQLLEAAKAEGFHALDPAKEAAEPVKEAE
jgi:predicted nucleic acid-binding protein